MGVWRADRYERLEPSSRRLGPRLTPRVVPRRTSITPFAGRLLANDIAWDGRRLFVTDKLGRAVYGMEMLRRPPGATVAWLLPIYGTAGEFGDVLDDDRL